MLAKTLQTIRDKMKEVPKLYSTKIRPLNQNMLNMSIIQPIKSLLRYHQYKKAYNTNYSSFITFCKSFGIVYLVFSYCEYDFALKSVIGGQIQATEYIGLVKRASEDSAGADKVEFVIKEMIEKGKKNGLLSIELNQIAYLLEPYEIAWQGRYIASLKA